MNLGDPLAWRGIWRVRHADGTHEDIVLEHGNLVEDATGTVGQFFLQLMPPKIEIRKVPPGTLSQEGASGEPACRFRDLSASLARATPPDGLLTPGMVQEAINEAFAKKPTFTFASMPPELISSIEKES